MSWCGESLIGADPLRNWQKISNVPVTQRDGAWYLHVLPSHEDRIILDGVPEPKEIKMLNYDVPITWYTYDKEHRRLIVNVSMTMRDNLDTVMKVKWLAEPE